MTKRLGALLLILLASAAGAIQLPLKINFQGRLTDPVTNNPRNGLFDMTFKLYRGPDIGATQVYSEQQLNVPVNNGVFAVVLGSAAFLSADLLYHTSAYLGIEVQTDGEMVPRQQLVMAPYAYTSAQLASDVGIGVNAGFTYSTFTAQGNLQVANGIVASTASFINVTAGSGTFTSVGAAQYSVDSASGVIVRAGTLDVNGPGGAQVLYGITAATGTFSGEVLAASATFSATGNGSFGVESSSGFWMLNGTLKADGSANIRNTVNVGSVTVGVSASSTSIVFSGSPSGDNYIAFPFISGGVITAKQVVVLTSTRTVSAVAGASSLNAVGIAVNAVGGAGQTVWVAVQGIVTEVPNSAAAISVGQRVGNSATAGRVVATTTAAAAIGTALTPAAASTSVTVLLDRR